MGSLEETCASLRAQIAATEVQLARLKRDLADAESAAIKSETPAPAENIQPTQNGGHRRWPLLQEEYRRYGRQMIVSQVGLQGQLKLRSAKVLLVGAGGLGCPAAQYLAGAGVGTIGMIDGDTVEVSNLHRQVLHRGKNVGKYKVDSAIEFLKELNPHPTYIAHRTHLMPAEAPAIFSGYDLILDCTDNPATRYLISDTAVLLGKPLVSASALRTEGQLMVLNNPHGCRETRQEDHVIDACSPNHHRLIAWSVVQMAALEAIKVITAPTVDDPIDGAATRPCDPPALHIFSAYSTPQFRTIRLRSRRPSCAVCSAEASVTRDTITSGSTDYVFFCGSANPGSLLDPEERISAREYSERHPQPLSLGNDSPNRPAGKGVHTIIDVRDKAQFEICSLANSINIPISSILSSMPPPIHQNGDTEAPSQLPSWIPPELASANSTTPIYVVCRLGNDSQVAVQKMKELGLHHGGQRFVGDIRGGFRAWREQVDPEWPEY
ncbi:MoeZ/MoeB [Penicillium alfredii]|uniref:MoeZ/MoeB n=1 Tax=Penicillium alfredii TaxID=1506179 RepID=A0A9W9F1T2_9EURO|nr:MoeZ/MoeB [Penicillium alfredii]KAJ5091986.1 MoeZ/MoeB [Penicillium alfredii]